MSALLPRTDLRARQLLGTIEEGLRGRPKRLPAECFYDELGSALFEAITVLPEYGLTRADLRLLTRHASEVALRLGGPLDVVELGSGGGRKAQRLLQSAHWPGPLRYVPVDVSKAALDDCRERLRGLPGVEVVPVPEGYLEGLERAAMARRPGAKLLVLFLGSTFGNFERDQGRDFLSEARALLKRGDALLVSVDLEKDEERMLAAYDDPAGVTAAFNRNALARLNRELGADFDVAAFQHRAVYDRSARRIEMHLVARSEELVSVPALGLRLLVRAGEGIWTESSHKFVPGEILSLGSAAGFRGCGEWLDSEWPYSLSLLLAA